MPKGYWCGISVDWHHYCQCYRNYSEMEADAKSQWTAANAFSSPSSAFSPAHSFFSHLSTNLFSSCSILLSSPSLFSFTSTHYLPFSFLRSPLKLSPLCCLHHGHYGVCDWSPDIWPHDDWNSGPHFEHCGVIAEQYILHEGHWSFLKQKTLWMSQCLPSLWRGNTSHNHIITTHNVIVICR